MGTGPLGRCRHRDSDRIVSFPGQTGMGGLACIGFRGDMSLLILPGQVTPCRNHVGPLASHCSQQNLSMAVQRGKWLSGLAFQLDLDMGDAFFCINGRETGIRCEACSGQFGYLCVVAHTGAATFFIQSSNQADPSFGDKSFILEGFHRIQG